MKPAFKSKEYGIGGHNKLEVRVMEDGVQIWLQDGECNAIVYMDKDDMLMFAKVINKVKQHAPDKIEAYDFTTPVHKRVVKATAVTTEAKKPRKQRSDKGKKKSESYEEMKSRKIEEAMV
jgi:hypothetical protein